jgi:hypothetical protein
LAEAPEKNHPLKTGFYAVFYAVISNGAIAFCFLPILFLWWKDIRKVHTFWVLGIYSFLNGFDNLLEVYFLSRSDAGHDVIRQFSHYYSLLEAPLILLIFGMARHGRGRKGILLLLCLFLVAESILLRKGDQFLLLILGSGVGLIILSSLTGLLEYLKRMEHTRFENSMVFVYGGLLFAYGSMLIIYIFAHFHHASGSGDADSYLLYYLSVLLSAAVICAGLWTYGIHRPRGRSYTPTSDYSSSSS